MNTHDYIVQGLAAEMPRTMPLAEAHVCAERMWARVVSRLFPDPPDASGEWHRFGTHVACRGVPLEFAGEEDSEDGLPLWERVIEPETHARDFPLADVETAMRQVAREVTAEVLPEEIPCTICGTPSPPGEPCPVCHPVIVRGAPRGFGGLAATTSVPPIV